jgi:hypothetical protein
MRLGWSPAGFAAPIYCCTGNKFMQHLDAIISCHKL